MPSGGRLIDLEVLVVGIEDWTSRDVIRALVAEGAIVTAAACEEAALASLQRDLSLYRTTIKLAAINLFNSSEMRLFAENLQGQQSLPHLIVCCRPASPQLTLLTARLLQPSLVLDALPQAVTGLGRAIASIKTASLAAWLERGRRRSLFGANTRPRQVRIAGCIFEFRRWEGSVTRGRAAALQGGHKSPSAPSRPSTRLSHSQDHNTDACHPAPRRQQG